jgi:hypothetical protein
MPFNSLSAVADFEKRFEGRIAEVRLTVFVCGPAVLDASGAPSTDRGAAVRRFISEQLSSEGHCYVWGEHLSSKARAREGASVRRFDDADKEIVFAIHGPADLVVIFPSSSGSFAELGIFCTHEEISRKLLVIFDKQYRGARSFVVRALGKAARGRKATVRFSDYDNHQGVWRVVRQELRRQVTNKTVSLSHVPT